MQEIGAWQVSTAVWNDWLFAALAAHVILLLQREVISRRGCGLDFDKDELVVVVCAAIRRVVGPFQVMDSLLSNRHVLAQFDLEGIHPENVQIRLPSDLTGPSAVDAIHAAPHGFPGGLVAGPAYGGR